MMLGRGLMLDASQVRFFEQRHDAPQMTVATGLKETKHRILLIESVGARCFVLQSPALRLEDEPLWRGRLPG